MKALTSFLCLGVLCSSAANGNIWGYEVEELENLRLEGGFQPISPNDALAARSQWKEGGDVIMGTPHYPPDSPVEILTKQNVEGWNGDVIDPYHSSLEVYEGEDPVDRTFYKSFKYKYRPFHLPRPVLKLQKLKNLKLALKSKLKLKLKSKPLLKFPKLKKLKFKGLHKPKRKPSYKPHSTGRPSYKTVTPEEPTYSYETTNTLTQHTSLPTYTVSYSPVFEEPTSYKPAPKSPPSTSLAPAYRPPPVLEAYSSPAHEEAKKFPSEEGFVEVASR